jgi:hypothetical protein
VKFGEKSSGCFGLIDTNDFAFLGCNTIVLLHNILEQVDLESAGFTSNKIGKELIILLVPV